MKEYIMFDSESLVWLQQTETSLSKAINALLTESQRSDAETSELIDTVIDALNARRAIVQSAMIEVMQGRMEFDPPTQETIEKTKLMTDGLQALVRQGKRYDAILKLLTDTASLLANVVVDMPMPRPGGAAAGNARL
jgi:hypothetical protein